MTLRTLLPISSTSSLKTKSNSNPPEKESSSGNKKNKKSNKSKMQKSNNNKNSTILKFNLTYSLIKKSLELIPSTSRLSDALITSQIVSL